MDIAEITVIKAILNGEIMYIIGIADWLYHIL
jgi:hypothetical protein